MKYRQIGGVMVDRMVAGEVFANIVMVAGEVFANIVKENPGALDEHEWMVTIENVTIDDFPLGDNGGF